MKPLPVIHQALGEIPLTFFKLYAPSYRCPRCGEKGLFVKVSANDGRTLTEYWDIEGPREDFKNMEGLELHQGIGAKGGFRYEPLHESSVADHLDIFGTLFVRSSRLIQALVQANLFINRQAPVGPERNVSSCVPAVAESGDRVTACPNSAATRGTSGQREKGDAGPGLGQPFSPPKAIFPGRAHARSEMLPPSRPPARAFKLEGVRDE